VTVTTGGEVATGANLFTVETTAAATFASIDPASAAQGDTVSVQITGSGTHFTSASQVSFSDSGIAASDVVLLDKNNLSATVTIDPALQPAVYDVTVTTGSEVVTGTGVFEVIRSADRAVILREAVHTYLRQNLVTGDAKDVCVAFIASINSKLRDQISGKALSVTVTVEGGK
jgi:hypothetical protein